MGCAWIAAIAVLLATPGFAWAQDDTNADQSDVTREADDADAQALEDAKDVEVDVPDDLDDIENLVVTARRRPEFLQQTPVAATVLGGELLEQRGVDSLEDAAVYVPNLSAFSGVQHQGTFYQRGVGQRDAVVTLDPGVGIYVDDVYVARAQGALLPTVDVERLEVLRGPQGTLYGKNTIGGAIKIVSQKPGPVPYITGALGGGSYETINGSATVNAPIIDDLLYSRFTFAGKDSEGYTQNIINDKHYNDDNLKAMRAQFRLLPLEYLTLDLSGHYSTQRMDGRGAKCRTSNPALGGVSPFIGAIQANCDVADSETTWEFASDLDDHYFLDTWGTSLVADWEVGSVGFVDSFDVKSISSYQHQDVEDAFLDLDATGGGFPFQIYQRTVEPQGQTQFSQELQGTLGVGDLFRLTSGAYGFWEDTNRGDVLSNNAVSQRVERTEIENSSYAIYTQGSVTPLDWMELTYGVRHTWETKSAKRTIVFNGFAPIPGELPVEHASEDFQQTTHLAGIAFMAPESLLSDTPIGSSLLYFTWSQGYKSGGFSTRRDPSIGTIPDFKPEELDNYEVGIKLDFFDNRLIFNTALFYSEYEDIQLTVARAAATNPAPFTPDIGSSIDNAGEAVIKGFEMELIARPFDLLVLRGSVGLTDAEYEEFDDVTFIVGNATTTAVPLDRSDEAFYNIPDLSIDGSVEWPFSVFGYGMLTPLAHVYYQTATNNHFTHEGYVTGDFRQNSYTLLDLRLIYDLPDERTQLSVFCNNVTDIEYFTSAVDLTNTLGVGGRYYEMGRFIGGEIRYRWENPGFMDL
jgi:iron complex outermembrane receptor protein